MGVNELNKCIACPVAHSYLKGYYKFINEKDISKRNEIKRELNQIIHNDSSTDNSSCVVNIKRIVRKLKKLFSEIRYNDKGEEDIKFLEAIESINNTSLHILISMQGFSKDNGLEIDDEITEKDLKIYDKGFTPEEEEQRVEDIYFKFHYTLDDYCNLENAKYNYCSPKYNDNDYLKSICNEIDTLKSCEKNKKEKGTESNIEWRILDLSDYNKEIAISYLTNAQKRSGYVIDRLMKIQRLTDTDISKLFYVDSQDINNKNKIQGLHNINSESNQLSKEELKRLSRIFLVSENVLTCGTGIIYGNWKTAINENKNYEVQNSFDDDDDTENGNEKRPSMITKQKIFKKLEKYINLNDTDFKNLISDNPQFFTEKEICLFTYKYENETYYDYDSMYKFLVNPENFDLLLSILEEQECKTEHQLIEETLTDEERTERGKYFLDIVNNL